MANQAGPTGWDFSNPKEKQEVEQQAKDFVQDNLDILGPLTVRIEQWKKDGKGDDLLMLISILMTTSEKLLKELTHLNIPLPTPGSRN